MESKMNDEPLADAAEPQELANREESHRVLVQPRGEPPGPGYQGMARWQRLRVLSDWAQMEPKQLGTLTSVSALPHELSERLIENSVGNLPVPLGVAVNFVMDGQPLVVPMAIEQAGVIAATSRGAALAAEGGGFRTEVRDPVTIGQVELKGIKNPLAARTTVLRRSKAWIAELNESMPNMVERGGGVKGIEARIVGEWRLVLHLHVDTRDAMGSGTVNRLCEEFAPKAAKALGGTVGLRSVSNLADHRLVAVRCTIPAHAVGGVRNVDAIVAADHFGHEDPYRAATQNKAVMDAVDAVLLATGNDWRAVEAGAHAYAARDGRYASLTRFRRAGGGALEAALVMPMPVGTVGGMTRLHPTVQVVQKIMEEPDGKRLAAIAACAGLAHALGTLRRPAANGSGVP